MLSNVTKIYAGRAPVVAVRDVSLQIATGERVAIIGRSGSGKSTLLNLMGGLDVPTSGAIHLDGRALGELGDRDRTLLRRTHLSYVFQAYHLLPTLTCAQNVAIPLHLQGLARRVVDARVARALDEVGLTARAAHLPDELSGGERQRTALARALATEPRLLLADEPTGNLDGATGGHVLDLLGEVSRARGATLVLVTHDEHAARACDRIVTLRDGCLVEGAAA